MTCKCFFMLLLAICIFFCMTYLNIAHFSIRISVFSLLFGKKSLHISTYSSNIKSCYKYFYLPYNSVYGVNLLSYRHYTFSDIKSISNIICPCIGLKKCIATQRVYKYFPIFSFSTHRVLIFLHVNL